MKKYIIPAINVADIENEVILAGSPDTPIVEENAQGDAMSNQRSLFDWNNEE